MDSPIFAVDTGDWKVAQTRGQECPRHTRSEWLPPCGAGFPACGFAGLSSPEFQFFIR